MTAMQHTRTYPLASLATALLVVVMTACGGGSDTAGSSPQQAPSSTSVGAGTPATETNGSPNDSRASSDDDLPLPVIPSPTTEVGASDPANDPSESAPTTTPLVPLMFADVELAAVEGPAPTQVPPAPSSPTELKAVPVTIGDLTSNAPGCASNCITSAVLRPGAIGTLPSVAVSTNIAVRTTLWMSTKQISTSAAGTPVFAGSPAPVATSGGFRREWSAQIEGLSPGHRYRAILRVVDRFGNERFLTGEIRTPQGQPSNDLAANGGCTFQCITMGVVQATTDYDRVNLVVATNVPTRLAVYVSIDAPGSVAGSPVLPTSALIESPNALAVNHSLPVSGLEGDTVYHVIVKAQDASGRIAHRVGQFRTSPPPPARVEITIERIYLAYDGDPGSNKGEVSFVWGRYGTPGLGVLEVSRQRDGFEFAPSDTNSWVVEVGPEAVLPSAGATVWEIDWDGVIETRCNEYTLGLVVGQEFVDACDARGNGAFAPAMTVQDLAGLQRCSTYGFIEGEDDACLLLTTVGGNEDYAQIKVLVSYRIL